MKRKPIIAVTLVTTIMLAAVITVIVVCLNRGNEGDKFVGMWMEKPGLNFNIKYETAIAVVLSSS
jgi:hypothetical protein